MRTSCPFPTGVDEDGADKAKQLMTYPRREWRLLGDLRPGSGSSWPSSKLPEVQAIESVAMAAEQFNAIGRTDMPHKAFIEIQTAWETAVGNALASADADVAASLQAGNEQIQAILDRP